MAPKKNENKTALVLKIPNEKRETRARLKKDSPKLKKQIIKVKFPPKKQKNDMKKKKILAEEPPDLTEADAKKMLILDRMNEVARAQLVRDCPVDTEVVPETVVKKRGRKKKIQETESDEVVPKKKLKGPNKVLTKVVKTSKETDEVVPKKKLKGPNKIPKKVVKPSKVAGPKQQNTRNRRGRQAARGKPKTDDDSTITSPSILSQGRPECKTPVKQTQKPIKSPAGPGNNNSESGRTSVTSASEMSWTKDISGSSTTTCKTVSSTDFVCIDGKLPEVKLNKIDHVLKKEIREATPENKEKGHSLSEDSSSSDSSSSSSSSSSSTTVNNSVCRSVGLNLSTSSISPVPHSPTYTATEQSFNKHRPDIDEVSSTIEMLTPKLKSFDLSFPDFGNETESILDMKPFEEKIFGILSEEYNAILECNFLNELLSEKCSVSKTNVSETERKPSEEPDFAKPDISVISNKSVCDNHNAISDDSMRRSDHYDDSYDDDALSLFAESLTGMDSTRMSSTGSVAHAPLTCEEYVPQPLGKRPSTAANYQPTKINDIDLANAKTKPVCEKQNADSTSIHKEPELDGASNKIGRTAPGQKQLTGKTVAEIDQPQLTIYYYKSFRNRSLMLQGVCFFNLMSKCKKDVCFYPHRSIEEPEFRKRLSELSEEQFFQEYMHIAKWPNLRRTYIKCFVDECQRRELPKILVEIVIDFLSKVHPNSSEDSSLRVEIVESTLMYLNGWDLEVCEQLLRYKIGDKVLCDVFMEIIGNTQNFSRFKHVFINLAGYMVHVNRTFDVAVAAHVLERVCILPFEAPLSAVLVSIIEKTDRKIFENKMMDIFEKQLQIFNIELYDRLITIKKESVASEESMPVSEQCPPSLPSSCGGKELEPLTINMNGNQDYEQRYTSPDTTNTDNLNKPVADPVIIRTFNHLIRPPNMCKPKHPRAQAAFPRTWNQQSILQKIPRMPQMRPQKRPMGGPLERSQFKFPRRYGPDFYGNRY